MCVDDAGARKGVLLWRSEKVWLSPLLLDEATCCWGKPVRAAWASASEPTRPLRPLQREGGRREIQQLDWTDSEESWGPGG